MRKCYSCNRKKGDHLFPVDNSTKSGFRHECKSCRIKKRKKIKIELIRFLISHFKDNPCLHCGESNPILLQFDHLRDKKVNISTAVINMWSIERLQCEIDKCQVLCSNCHTLKTAKDYNWYMLQILNE